MNQPNLGKKIAELRKAKGYTQEELVEKCNISVRTLQRIESGEAAPRSYTIKIIFAALDYNYYDSSEIRFNKTGSIIFYRLEQFYRYFLDLFNFKTNKMKKIAILSIMFSAIVFGLFAIVTEAKAQKEDKTSNPTNDKKVAEDQLKNRGLNYIDFTAYGSIRGENGELIARDIEFNLSGVKVKVNLIMIN
jgi:transcriptional regulator with XRE-family HTH domain